MKDYLSKNSIFLVYAFSLIFLSYLVKQQDFLALISFYLIAFTSYLVLGVYYPMSEKWINRSFWIKLFLLFAFPQASDDIFRFYWDGMVCVQGISPYQYLPSELVERNDIFIDQDVYQKLNSKSYYSVYPPILQFVFGLCYFLSYKSVYLFSILWKLILLLADYGSIRLFKKISVSTKKWYWFAFNPLIMYEVFGNGHAEGLLLFLLVGVIWAIKQDNRNQGLVFLSLASAIKIFPLVFFPLLLKNAGIKKIVILSSTAVLLLLLFFLPIYPYFDHFLESIKLYFRKFEFNGSLFEIWKWIDYRRFGYDNIAGISRFLSFGFLLMLMVFSLRYLRSNESNPAKTIFWIWVSYLLLSSTVHPWYVVPVFLISLFISNLSGMVWSLLVILSYCWYDTELFKYKYIFMIIEYGILIMMSILEMLGKLDDIKVKVFEP